MKTTLRYASKTWPMTAANTKKLDAAHHKWLRISGVNGWMRSKTKKYDEGQVNTDCKMPSRR